jgi:methylglutaconyl-CoA hydratase
MQNSFETIFTELKDKVAFLKLNRPEQHNALNRTMVQELTRFFRHIGDDPRVQVVVMRGEGRSFCSGADLLWMKNSVNLTPEENLKESEELSELFETIRGCSKVVIGMAHGSIYGGGNGLLAACDLAYCLDDCRFSLSETRIGLAAATIAPYLLFRMPAHAVKELVFTAQLFNGAEARSTGLVNRSFASQEEMEDHVNQTLDSILRGGPASLIESKKLINNLSGFMFPEETSNEMARILAGLRVSPEAQEGMQAFVEKRKPNWHNLI